MKLLFFIILFLMILPNTVMGEEKVGTIKTGGEGYLNDVEVNNYKMFLNDLRKTDRKRVFIDYKEDRDTRYRKLRESAYFEAREAEILNKRLWDQRYGERWDRQSQLIEKVYSGSASESDRAAKALRYGYPGTGKRQLRY